MMIAGKYGTAGVIYSSLPNIPFFFVSYCRLAGLSGMVMWGAQDWL
jgi:hypothetical protein